MILVKHQAYEVKCCQVPPTQDYQTAEVLADKIQHQRNPPTGSWSSSLPGCVELTADLIWKLHNSITSKASRIFNLLCRYLYGCNQEVKSRAFTSLVRLHLHPHFKQDILLAIEEVQRKGARFVTSKYSYIESVASMLDTFQCQVTFSTERKWTATWENVPYDKCAQKYSNQPVRPRNLIDLHCLHVGMLHPWLSKRAQGRFWSDCWYSRLSLSRIPRDSLKYFEISVLRHIRFAELGEKLIRLTTFNKYMCNWTLKVRNILKILWKRGVWSNFSTFPQYFFTCC